jgi:Protein of unknown function, DUF547
MHNTLTLLLLLLNALSFPKRRVLNPNPQQTINPETALELARAGAWQQLEQAAFVVPQDQTSARAFWLNLYNALTLHAMADAGIQNSVLESLGFFQRYAYQVGDHVVSLNQIEHGILRGNRAALVGLPPFSRTDPRIKWVLPLDPRIHFALNCGAASCPPIRAYQAANLEPQLTLATQSYLAECRIEGNTVWLPRLLSYYANDFGEVLGFVRHFRPDLPKTARVQYLPYVWAKVYK